MMGRFVIGPHARSDAHRQLLRRMAEGQQLVGLAVSEPDAGAHPKRMACTARRDGNHWLIDGRKSHVSNGPAVNAFIVLAATGESVGRRQFDAFVVDAPQPGLEVLAAAAPALPPLGHAALSLQACAVADAQRLDTEGQAYDRIVRPVRTLEDALLASALVGAMGCELQALAGWLQGTQPSPATLRRLGALDLERLALEALADQAARHLERRGPDAALARLNVGSRLLFERWQGEFEEFAAELDDLGEHLHAIARDVRTVLGIARAAGDRRRLDAGAALLNTKESDEVPA
jgi:acyl-CoA dehydrogenase